MWKFLALRTHIAAFSGIILTIGILTAGVTLGTASPAFASVTVCLTNASTQCADVKDSSNTAGTRIWLYHSGNDDHWLVVQSQCDEIGLACFFIEDAVKPGLCMAATAGMGGEVKLEKCNDSGAWYNEGGNVLGNGFFGANGNLIANGSASKDFLYANRTGNWRQWNL